jgi:hypothetical protein
MDEFGNFEEDEHLKMALHMIKKFYAAPEDGKFELNNELKKYLNDIDEMCRAVHGKLISRQAVAVAVKTWEMCNPDVLPWKRVVG